MDLLSRFYQREDFHQSLSYARVMESIGWASIPLDGSRISVRQLGPIGLAKMQRPERINLPGLLALRRKLHLIHLIVEPTLTGIVVDRSGKEHVYDMTTEKGRERVVTYFQKAGFSRSSEHYAHSKTSLIDIQDDIDTVVQRFASKTRYNIKVSQRLVVSYETIPFAGVSKKLQDEFFSLHSQWSREKKVTGYTDNFLRIMMRSFSKNGWLITARIDGKLAGIMMVLVHDGIGYYFYTCSSKEGRDFHVPTGMTYQALICSKAAGADIFDFCSVYDERFPSDHPRWKGFTTFKERFSPTPIYYPHSFHRWF